MKTKSVVLAGFNIIGFLLIILAIILLIISILFLTVYKSDYVFFYSFQNKITYGFMIIGALSILIGVLGFYSFYSKHYIFVPIVIIGMLVVCLLLAGLGSWTYVVSDSKGALLRTIESSFNQTISTYQEGDITSLGQKNLDFFQKEFKCCGWDSYSDWRMS